jgi:hypothetical protein
MFGGLPRFHQRFHLPAMIELRDLISYTRSTEEASHIRWREKSRTVAAFFHATAFVGCSVT